ncbi:MAG: hypothetical protein JJ863_04625 [Deltaproteobacteria bacterium]|nr:hypothetical protein [Deltaproteobacteria bacterium]
MPKLRPRLLLAFVTLLLVVGASWLGFSSCHPSRPEPRGELGDVPPSEPTRLCVGGVRSDCRRPDRIRELLATESLVVVQAAPAPGGAQGAAVLTLRTPDGLTFDVKWRSLGSASRSNDPIAELGADRVQRLVLGPGDLVIPPTAPHCLPAASYERRLGHRRDAFDGSDCVLGIVSLWLHGAVDMNEARRTGVVPGEAGDADPGLYDPLRFERDARYRRNVAHLNLVAFLIAHGDAHAGQFVTYRDPPHLFLVDNSVAFGLDHRSAMDERQDLARIVVPSIPRETAARLRALTRTDLDELRVLAELRLEASGRLVATDAGEPFGDPDEGARRQGERVQLGLSPEQIEVVWSRVRLLQASLDDGSLGVF